MVHRFRWIYAIVVSALVAVYLLAPATHVAVVAAVVVTSIGAIVFGIVAYHPTRRAAWILVAVGVAIAGAGEISYDLFATGGTVDAFPSLTDALYLAVYPPLASGLLWLGLARRPSRDVSSMIDTAALALTGSFVAWLALVQPTVDSLHLTGVAKVVAVGGWVGDVVVLAAVMRLVYVWSRNVAAGFLGAAMMALFAGDVLYGQALIHGTWQSGGPVDVLLLLFFAFCGAAGITPSMAQIGSAYETRHRFAARKLTALAAALLVAPTALIAEATRGPVRAPVVIAVVSILAALLAVWRLAVAMREQRVAAARDAASRRAAHEIGLATTPEAVVGILSTALAAITRESMAEVRLVDSPAPAPPADHVRSLRVPVETHAGRDAGAKLEPTDREFVFTAVAEDIAESEDVLVGLADNAAVALQRIELDDRVRASQKEQDILAYRASHDALTGLANAGRFRDRLRDLGRTALGKKTVGVLFIDLDDFKAINDTLGHEAGDTVLITAADRIRTSIRDVDLGARLGGDEFAALLPDVNTEHAYATAARIAEVLALPAMISGLPVSCPASIGVATATTADEYAHVMRRADAALYAAKADGKGRWRPYRPMMRSPLHRGSDLRAELQNVLHGAGVDAPDMGGLTMHYQPIVELADGSVYGYEALIRWRHPARGSIPVAELIQVAEQTGLIVPLGNWALSQTVSDAVKLARASDDGARYVSANVSPTQLRQPDFADRLRDAMSAAGTDPSQIIIEMTESQPLTGDDEIWQVLGDLRSDGIRIAIDDYGTGHASLGYLRQPIIDILKLDRMFLSGMSDHRGRLLVNAVVQLTRELNIDLVAEGVEDHATREMLVELGCTLGQGHLFARAMPLADAAQWSFAVPAGSSRHE